jgi:lycopene beta-cyclase
VQKHYDYIIAGAGAAGLTLAWKLVQSSLQDRKILIVDNDLDAKNDKTWCFWDSGYPPFSDIIYKQWNNVEVSTSKGRFSQSLDEYTYHCLRSIDFQNKILTALQSHPDFDLLEAKIVEFANSTDTAVLHTKGKSFSADYIFQSCFNPWSNKVDNPRYPLLQHFLGWDIELDNPLLDENTFTLMDFDETFSDGIAFIYLLPWSQKSGLIEYTIFSNRVASEAFYKEKLSLYLNNRFNLQPIDYQIQRKEFGKIPMQDHSETPWYEPRIMNMGTQGGLTKPSTGYTFRRIQNHADAIIAGLLSEGIPQPAPTSEFRYKAYDLWLLQIIHDHPDDALRVFDYLFRNNSMDDVFRFLGEETTYEQDLKIMSSVPYLPFLRAIWKTRNRLREI